MRRRYSVTLFGLAAPLFLLQFTPLSCLPGTTDGGGTTGVFNLPPTVILRTDIQRGVAPLTVQFSSSDSSDDGVIVNRLWDFGDGVGTSQEIAPTHRYQTTGTFTVRVTLTDDRGASASATTIISVTERPVAVIVVDRTSAEAAPAMFSFDGSDSFDPDARAGEQLLYRWDFGDGSRELLAEVTHTFATAGTYRVRLTVTDAVGVTGYDEQIIEVGIPRPSISFRSPPSDVTNVVCTNTNSSYLWTHAVYDVQPAVPFTLRAGLDGDTDACNALVAIYDAATGGEEERLVDVSEVTELMQGALNTAVFSASTSTIRLLAGGDDGIARLYDPVGGTLLRRYTGNGSAINGLAFSPSGSTFVIGYADGGVVLRETNSNTIVRPFIGHAAAVNGVAFSPAGDQILTGDDAGIAILWNAADGTELLRYDHGGAAVTAVAFSPTNPQRVLTGADDDTARLWSTVNGSLTQEYAPVYSGSQLVAGHSDDITAVAFSPDGSLLATAGGDNTVQLWNTVSGGNIRTFDDHTDAVLSVAFSPDGTQLIAGSEDDTAMVWEVATGNQVRTLQPCSSPVTAVGFSPDGGMVLVAVAAQNDIRLDTTPSSGNDLNLTLPTGLSMRDVPVGAEGREYFFWIEIRTDRTTPSRTYSATRINVVPEFTEDISDDTPTIPFRNVRDPDTNEVVAEIASVIMPRTQRRQILDIGQLDLGDRIYVSMLSMPAYGQAYTQTALNPLGDASFGGSSGGFSLMVLDSREELFAWYESGLVLFTRDSKLIIGHNSASYYVVLDGTGDEPTPGVNIRIEREFSDTTEPRNQYVYLNFDGGRGLAVAGSAVFNLSEFAITGRDATSLQTIRNAIIARVDDLLDPYGFTVSDTAPTQSTQPRLTIYFDVDGVLLDAKIPDRNEDGLRTATDLQFWGVPNYIDPRNETLSGRAVVSVAELMNVPAYAALADAQLGLTIGNSALHQIGLMCGLRETTQALPDDIMTDDPTEVDNAALDFTTANLAASGELQAIGVQNAEELLAEIFGTD